MQPCLRKYCNHYPYESLSFHFFSFSIVWECFRVLSEIDIHMLFCHCDNWCFPSHWCLSTNYSLFLFLSIDTEIHMICVHNYYIQTDWLIINVFRWGFSGDKRHIQWRLPDWNGDWLKNNFAIILKTLCITLGRVDLQQSIQSIQICRSS